jgi:dynein heavy chain
MPAYCAWPWFKEMVKPVVDSSVEVYRRISEELLPTPAKSHYTFNLRDLSKVLQGILLITPQNCPTKDVMTRLWAGAYTRPLLSST